MEDTGVGVPDDRVDELFTEFATIDTSYTRKFGGTGLGLSICKALTTAMNGEIGYIKNAQAGSTFWFELPLEEGDPAKVVEEESLESAQQLLAGMDNIRILLAEDNVANQLVVSTMLERLGCAVDTVGAASKVPIIALTAYALDEDRQKVLAAGMDDFVSKSISRIELARVLARQINGQRAMTADPEKPALFDETTLSNVFADIDDDLRQRIVDEFKNDVSRHLQSRSTALETKDDDLYEKATHGLKGVTGTFGATELSRLSAQAKRCSQGRTGRADRRCADRTRQSVRQWRRNRHSGRPGRSHQSDQGKHHLRQCRRPHRHLQRPSSPAHRPDFPAYGLE